jgi:hypothetical protein
VRLYDKIGSIEFSPEEKDRLERCLLDPSSSQHEIFLSHATAIHDHDFWRRKQRQFRVTGFRDGHPKAVAMVLQRALDSLKKHPWRVEGSAYPTVATIYARAFQLYLQEERRSLSRLLKQEEFRESHGTDTEQILRCIVRSAPLYEVETDHVHQLYELWGFSRSENVNAILDSAQVDVETVRRIVEERVGAIRRELSQAIESSSADFQQRLQRQIDSLATLSQKLDSVREEISERSRLTPPDWVKALHSVGNAQADPEGDQNQRRVRVPRQVRRQDAETAAAIQTLQTRIESHGRQLKEVRARLDATGKPPPSPVESSKTNPATVSLAGALEKWRLSFTEIGLRSPSLGSTWIAFEMVLRSRFVLTDKPRWISDLYRLVPSADIRITSASPHWTTEADWRNDLAFLSDHSAGPRALILLDFDVALQETYLVPSLNVLRASLPSKSPNRMILVPHEPGLRSVSPRALEFMTVLDSVEQRRLLPLIGSGVRELSPTSTLPQLGSALLRFVESRTPHGEEDLRLYASNVGVQLPPSLVQNYLNICEGLLASLSPRDSALASREATLMPWIERYRGESVARIMREALDRLEGQ